DGSRQPLVFDVRTNDVVGRHCVTVGRILLSHSLRECSNDVLLSTRMECRPCSPTPRTTQCPPDGLVAEPPTSTEKHLALVYRVWAYGIKEGCEPAIGSSHRTGLFLTSCGRKRRLTA